MSPLLAESFFRTLQLKSGKAIQSISRQAMDLLLAYSWPGNVRELRSTFEYAFVTCQKNSIGPEDLPASQGLPSKQVTGIHQQSSLTPRPKNSDQRKKEALTRALQEAEGNQSRAAELLGISRVTVWNQMKRFGLKAVREVKE